MPHIFKKVEINMSIKRDEGGEAHMEFLQLKNTIADMQKNKLAGISNRLDTTEEKISEFEDSNRNSPK